MKNETGATASAAAVFTTIYTKVSAEAAAEAASPIAFFIFTDFSFDFLIFYLIFSFSFATDGNTPRRGMAAAGPSIPHPGPNVALQFGFIFSARTPFVRSLIRPFDHLSVRPFVHRKIHRSRNLVIFIDQWHACSSVCPLVVRPFVRWSVRPFVHPFVFQDPDFEKMFKIYVMYLVYI